MKPGGKNFSSNDPSVATLEELTEAANYIGYAGSYTIGETDIIHRVETLYFQNWVGTSQWRYYELEDNNLTLRAEP